MNNLEEQISNTVQEVMDGTFSALEAYGNMKKLEKFLKSCISEIEDAAISEANLHDEKTFTEKGFKFTKREGKATYSFKHIESWNTKKDELKKIEDLSKSSLSNWEKFKTAVVDSDGVVIEPCQVKYSKEGISVVVLAD